MKVIDRLTNVSAQISTATFSFEYFLPRTEEGAENLYEQLERIVPLQPLFCDITWRVGTSVDFTINVAVKMRNMIGVETMMHITCVDMPAQKIDEVLDKIKAKGIENVLALRGDPPHGQDKFVQVSGGFSCARDLVKHIRSHYGEYFGITVAGYPEAHPDAITSEEGAIEEAYHKELMLLKEKVQAGADVIITQLFYDTELFLKFRNDCRQIGITCPIVPGIMPIYSYQKFKRFTHLYKTKIPVDINVALESIKDDDKAVKAFGVHLGIEMCKKLLIHGVKHIHIYTLNEEKSAIDILQNLGLIDITEIRKPLPWRRPRAKEEVRPIFWANRPRSYIRRTRNSEYWSPHYRAYSVYRFAKNHSRDKKIEEEWVIPLRRIEDVQELYASYYAGKLESHPWSEFEGRAEINEKLIDINSRGFLTINNQPAMNGEKSDSPIGWGGLCGHLYQKAYVEFFCAPNKLDQLIEKAKDLPTLTYIAVNHNGETYSNIGFVGVNVVAWGVFPGRGIVQPTVVDPLSFMVWKDEAFAIWDAEWASFYHEEDITRAILKEVKETFFLVSLVDNDYVEGDYFAVFENI